MALGCRKLHHLHSAPSTPVVEVEEAWLRKGKETKEVLVLVAWCHLPLWYLWNHTAHLVPGDGSLCDSKGGRGLRGMELPYVGVSRKGNIFSLYPTIFRLTVKAGGSDPTDSRSSGKCFQIVKWLGRRE